MNLIVALLVCNCSGAYDCEICQFVCSPKSVFYFSFPPCM